MSTFLFKGDPEQGGLPRRSNVRIEEAHTRSVVFEGRVSHSAHIELDPGKYLYSVVRLHGDPQKRRFDDVRYDGEFLHEVSEQTWKTLRNMSPNLCRTLNTSEGARWKCLVATCGEEDHFTSPMAALIHEVCDHMGIPREEFLANPLHAKSRLSGDKYARLTAEVAATKRSTPSRAAVLNVPQDDLADDDDNDPVLGTDGEPLPELGA